jgi:hypothetical protein
LERRRWTTGDEIREDASYGGSGGGWGIRFLSGVSARDWE